MTVKMKLITTTLPLIRSSKTHLPTVLVGQQGIGEIVATPGVADSGKQKRGKPLRVSTPPRWRPPVPGWPASR